VGTKKNAIDLLRKRKNDIRAGIKMPENMRQTSVRFKTLCDDILAVRYVDARANTLSVELENGSSVNYDPRRLKGVNVFREVERKFATGDRLQFTVPNKDLGVANRDLGTLTAIEEGKMTVRLDGEVQRTVTFDTAEFRQFDHGYAVTSHSSQGLTAGRVLANIDTDASRNLINARLACVVRFQPGWVLIGHAPFDSVRTCADGRLDVGVTQPPLDISRIPPCSEKVGRMRVTEHVWRRLQPGSFRELTEQIDHSRILHRSSDFAAPPVREDIVVRSLAVLMDQVVCVQRHRLFRDMDHIGRPRLCKSAVAVGAGAYRSLGEHVGNKLFLESVVGGCAHSTTVKVDEWFLEMGKSLLDPLPPKNP
jgi:hypothetical protein